MLSMENFLDKLHLIYNPVPCIIITFGYIFCLIKSLFRHWFLNLIEFTKEENTILWE